MKRIFFLLIVLLALCNCGSKKPTQYVPATSEIVFYSQRSGSTQVFVMASDGSSQQQLTNLVIPEWRGDRGPLWSPDKEKIAFVAALKEYGHDLMLINSDGSKLDTLVHGTKDAWLGDWSPDGNRIVYAAIPELWMPPGFPIFIINSDGSGDQELVLGQQPRFCGNDKVVYTAGENIYIINSDGTGNKRLAERFIPHGPFYRMPVGSPDGSKIAFSTSSTYTLYGYSLGIMDADGSEQRFLVIEEYPGGTPTGIAEIEFSPDGQKILFLINDGDNSEICVINIDGSGLNWLTGGIACADGGASWSPDGRWIVFTSNKGGNKDIYKISVNGKILIQLTDNIADDFSPDW